MTVDKRITYRQNFKGGADASQFDKPTSQQKTPNVSAGGASFKDLGPSISGRDTGGNQPSYERSRKQFIDKFNQDRARDFKSTAFRRTYKPIGLDRFGSSNQLGAKGGLGNLFKGLLSMAVPGAGFLFNKGKQGIAGINNFMGNLREDLTGYRTQQEYDDAKQQGIDPNRNYSDFLAPWDMVPNTANQNAQQFLDFGNELAENTEQTMLPQNTSESYINSTSSANPVGDELGGILQNSYETLQNFYEEDDENYKEFGPNPFLPLEPTNFNTDQSGITNSDVASEFMDVGMNEAQKNKALQEMGFGVPADKIIPKLQQLDKTKFFMKTDERIRAKEFIDFYEQNQGPLTDEQKMQIYVKAGEEFEEDA